MANAINRTTRRSVVKSPRRVAARADEGADAAGADAGEVGIGETEVLAKSGNTAGIQGGKRQKNAGVCARSLISYHDIY
jgi:hypothetical protein